MQISRKTANEQAYNSKFFNQDKRIFYRDNFFMHAQKYSNETFYIFGVQFLDLWKKDCF